MSGYLLKFKQAYSVKIGGRRYPVVKIGNQLWMAENLDWKFTGLTFRDGTSGNTVTADATIAQGAYYNYDESTYGESGNKYGMLYNWTAADYINQHLSELKVHDGWHVPTLDEWTTLSTECGGVDTGATKLKSAVGWNSGNGLDSYGFTAFPAGLFTPNFSSIGEEAYFWISNESDDEAYYCYFDDSSFIDLDSYYKIYGYSLRLVKSLT